MPETLRKQAIDQAVESAVGDVEDTHHNDRLDEAADVPFERRHRQMRDDVAGDILGQLTKRQENDDVSDVDVLILVVRARNGLSQVVAHLSSLPRQRDYQNKVRCQNDHKERRRQVHRKRLVVVAKRLDQFAPEVVTNPRRVSENEIDLPYQLRAVDDEAGESDDEDRTARASDRDEDPGPHWSQHSEAPLNGESRDDQQTVGHEKISHEPLSGFPERLSVDFYPGSVFPKRLSLRDRFS